MTECIGSPAQEMAEQYLAGELPELEAESFENHYFGCDLCHEHLLALKEIRDGLAREPIVMAARASVAGPGPARPRQSFGGRILAFPVPMAILASLAAVLLVAAVLVGIQRSTPVLQPGHGGANSTAAAKAQPAESVHPGVNGDNAARARRRGVDAPAAQAEPPATELAALADMRLPGYQQPQLRGEEAANGEHSQFLSGMQAYTQGDCGAALAALEQVPATAADGVAAKLYSGLCQFQGHELESAQASFSAVVDAGDTPELETAEYFLAQTRLLHGDARGARNWLTRTIALHGDYEERAQKQAALLPR